MKQKQKKFFYCSLLSLIVMLGVMISIVIIFDPFMKYGIQDHTAYDLNDESSMYYNPSIAKFYDYDAVIMGSSMTHNFKTSEAEELFHKKTVKLGRSGGYSRDNADLMNILFEDHNVQLIIMSLDYYAYSVDSSARIMELPEYLYEPKLMNEFNYLLNKSILLKTIPHMINYSVSGNQTTTMDDYQNWQDNYKFGEAVVKDVFENDESVQKYKSQKPQNKEIDTSIVMDNLNNNLLPYIQEHPDTKFYFFYPPYSILQWTKNCMTGSLDANIKVMQLLADTLLPYENVSLYFYASDKNLIENLDYYKDLQHYSEDINSFILEDMSQNDSVYKLNNNNVSYVFENFSNYINSYNYENYSCKSSL